METIEIRCNRETRSGRQRPDQFAAGVRYRPLYGRGGRRCPSRSKRKISRPGWEILRGHICFDSSPSLPRSGLPALVKDLQRHPV